MKALHTLVALLFMVSAGAVYAQQGPEGVVDDIVESPSFFEMHSRKHADPVNVELFREGKIRLHPLGIHSIEGFDWRTHKRSDQSFWIRLERFEYMCAILDSDADLDRELARAWYTGWLDAHEANMHPNKGSRDAMGVGMRVMMIARYIRHLEIEEPEQRELIDRLRAVIPWHQEYLKNPRNFNTTSNHGMWESMGLFETTRVVPDSALTMLALQRLIKMSEVGVSSKGLEKEHSVDYHFYFYTWLAQYTSYLQSLERLQWKNLHVLVEAEARMREATWHMYDHRGRMAQIGDTDDKLAKDVPPPPKKPTPLLFDAEAGFAIYKDSDRAKAKRYVVLNIQNTKNRLTMPYHTHNDMMAVYYSDDGEVILGDGGRYSYANSPERRFFQSSASHNVVIPYQTMLAKSKGGQLAGNVWEQRDDDEVRFGLVTGDKTVSRTVTIVGDRPVVRIHDVVNIKRKHVVLWNLGMDIAGLGLGETTTSETGGTGPAARTHHFTLQTRRGREFDMRIHVSGVNNAPEEIQIFKGSDVPMLGWYAPDYNHKWPVPVIVVNLDLVGHAEVTTEIESR